MLRRGKVLWTQTKAKVNASKRHNLLLAGAAIIAILVAMMLIPPQALGMVSGSPTAEEIAVQEAEQEAEAARLEQQAQQLAAAKLHHRAALRYRKKAHHWNHKLGRGHLRLTHRKLVFSGSPVIENRRRVTWKKRAERLHRAYIRQQKIKRDRINRCVSAGFPRWYCPTLIKAAIHEGKLAWSSDSHLAWIISHESGFRPCVRNGGTIDCSYRGDRAFGLFQFLGSTWAGTGVRMTSDAYWQTIAGLRYVGGRYHTPAGAVRFWRSNHWY